MKNLNAIGLDQSKSKELAEKLNILLLQEEYPSLVKAFEEGDFNGATMELEDLINRLKYDKLV